MFNEIVPGNSTKKIERKQLEAEERQKDFALKQQSFNAATRADHIDIEIQQNRSDLIKWQQELDEELMELVLQFKGIKQLANGQYCVSKETPPMCNDLCIEQIVIPHLKSFMNKNQFNTNLDEDMIKSKIKRTANKIAMLIGVKYEYYGIVQRQNLRNISRLMKNYMIDSAYRSLKGWTKKTDSTNFKRLESSFDKQEEQPRKGLFGF